MTKTSIWRATLGALLAAMALPGFGSPSENAVDPTGVLGAVPMTYGDHTVNAALANALEVDSYTFSAQAGDSVRLLIRGLSPGLDPSLVLRDPAGSIVGTTFCDGSFGAFAGLCSLALDRSLPGTGLYTLNVSDVGQDEAGSYQMHLEQYPPVNNWLGVPYATAVNERLGHTTDLDFFAFTGVAGTGVRVSVAGQSVGLDSALQIWDPSGTRITNASCDGSFGAFATLCVTSVDLNLSLAGTYKLGVSDVGWDEVGNYRLNVSCLFGACPLPTDPPPMPVPEPSQWALMLRGSAVLRAWRRRR
jgi:hypothetical protein